MHAVYIHTIYVFMVPAEISDYRYREYKQVAVCGHASASKCFLFLSLPHSVLTDSDMFKNTD